MCTKAICKKKGFEPFSSPEWKALPTTVRQGLGDADRRYTDRKYLSHKIALTAKFESFARFVPILNKCAWGSLRTLRFGGGATRQGKHMLLCDIFLASHSWGFICGAADRSGRGKRCSSSCFFLGGGTIFQFPMQFFGMWKGKNLVSKGVWKGKNCVYHDALICQKYYIPRSRSVEVSLSCFSSDGYEWTVSLFAQVVPGWRPPLICKSSTLRQRNRRTFLLCADLSFFKDPRKRREQKIESVRLDSYIFVTKSWRSWETYGECRS